MDFQPFLSLFLALFLIENNKEKTKLSEWKCLISFSTKICKTYQSYYSIFFFSFILRYYNVQTSFGSTAKKKFMNLILQINSYKLSFLIVLSSLFCFSLPLTDIFFILFTFSVSVINILFLKLANMWWNKWIKSNEKAWILNIKNISISLRYFFSFSQVVDGGCGYQIFH